MTCGPIYNDGVAPGMMDALAKKGFALVEEYKSPLTAPAMAIRNT